VPIKAVIDTNIWVSALISPGNARAIADALAANQFALVSSKEILAELIDVLNRPKFKATIPEARVQRIVTLILKKAQFVELQHIPAVSRDPKDDIFLACAAAEQTDYLVTGDADLLVLDVYQSTKVITPAEFLNCIRTAV
jgi:putative PIN family toxin of toxin-antitoxin system